MAKKWTLTEWNDTTYEEYTHPKRFRSAADAERARSRLMAAMTNEGFARKTCKKGVRDCSMVRKPSWGRKQTHHFVVERED